MARGKELVFDRQDDLLGPEGLLSRQRRADAVAATALGARLTSHEWFPGKLADPVDAVVLALHEIGNRVKCTHRAEITEKNIEGRRQEMQVLGIRDVDEEEQHYQYIRPPEDSGQ